MKSVRVERENGEFLCNAMVADSMKSRGIGLLGKKSLPDDQGLWIKPCTSVHTFFMRFPIDILYLDKDNTVVKQSKMKVNRMSFGGKGAKTVLELPWASIEKHDIRVGEQLALS